MKWRPTCVGSLARLPTRVVATPGLGLLGPGWASSDRLEAEGHAIGDAHAAGGSAAIRPDTVIRLLHRELARRPQRVRPDRGADVATHITGLSGEGEPTLHLESVDARSHPRGDEADHGIVVHMQHVRPHGLSDLADFFRVRGRSEEHTSELQSLAYLVCRLLLEKKKNHHDRHC